MTAHEILHIIRNPWGWSEEEVRQARIAAAYLIEQQAAELAILKQRNPNGQRNPSEGDPCGRSCEGRAYRIELRQALAKVEQQAQELEALRGFAQDIMECWPHSELDGCDLQDIAETHGILRLEERAEPSGENCACAEYGDFPAECYRKTELLTGQ